MTSQNSQAPAPPLIVFVEDEAMIRMATAAALMDAGFEVVEAEDAMEALAFLQVEAHRVSILFTDVNLPGDMDGLMLADHARRHWPWIRLLVTSGRIRPTGEILGGHGSFIPKPYTLGKLVRELLPPQTSRTSPSQPASTPGGSRAEMVA